MYSSMTTSILKGRYGLLNGIYFLLLSIVVMTGCLVTAQAAANNPGFDHDETRFPLDFNHARASCDSCHVQGIFLGTPTQCYSCHSSSGRIQATAPSPRHIRTTEDCEYCHQQGQWDSVVKVDHFAVSGSCQSCHNGVIATGKNDGHIQSSEVCDDCHRTFSWQGAVFDHSNISGSCISCHNGIVATGKHPAHILSTDACDDCHRSISWSPLLRMDHDAVIGSCQSCHNGVIAEGKHPQHLVTASECDYCHITSNWTTSSFNHGGITTACMSCHDGVTATGKTTDHIPSGTDCELCHTTQAWTPASFDHDNVTGRCSSCHDGVTATGKADGHFVSSQECNDCHNTTSWQTLLFVHQSTGYPGEHRQKIDCMVCHASNSDTVSWNRPDLQPDCAGCHAGDYKPGEHRDVSVDSLKDCSGACHEPGPEHRVSDSKWD